jgi:hypothetical protein
MKQLLCSLLLCLFTMPALCQTMPVDKETGLITYSEVVKVDSANQKQLYKVAKLWVLNVYGSGRSANQLMLNDGDATIMLKSSVATGYGKVYYTLTIECKDGRYRYIFTDFTQQCSELDMCKGCGGLENETCSCLCNNMLANTKKVWATFKSETNDNILGLIADMKKYVAQTVPFRRGDW